MMSCGGAYMLQSQSLVCHCPNTETKYMDIKNNFYNQTHSSLHKVFSD